MMMLFVRTMHVTRRPKYRKWFKYNIVRSTVTTISLTSTNMNSAPGEPASNSLFWLSSYEDGQNELYI